MIRKYLIPILAVAGLAFAIHTVRSEAAPRPASTPVAEPARSPFGDSVAGSGIIEASTQNIAIGTHVAGVVTEVFVKPGARVTSGDPLFKVDDRSLQAQRSVAVSKVAVAEQTLARLRAQPRKEDVPPAEARLRAARADLSEAREQLEMLEAVQDQRAVVREDLVRRRSAVAHAEARVAETEAQLTLLKAGAWAPEIAVAEAQLAQAHDEVRQIEVEIERLTVRAKVDADVLQVNVRVGEFAQVGPLTQPLIVLGETRTLWVRCDIDENDAWRIVPGAKAQVSLRGNPTIKTDNVSFVRIEPYVIPKRSLTGESTERVDTRVLQVVYAFPREALNAYVGQQVDVRIEAGDPSRVGTRAVSAN